MKTFNEFYQLVESMGFLKTKCMRCGKSQSVGKYIWNAGRAKCNDCGGALDVNSEDNLDEKTKLSNKIQALRNDPEVQIGQSISDMIHVNNMNPEEVYQKYKVDSQKAEELMDKAVSLFRLEKKMKKIDPNFDADIQQ